MLSASSVSSTAPHCLVAGASANREPAGSARTLALDAVQQLQERLVPSLKSEKGHGREGAIDWQAGKANLFDAQGRLRTQLRVAPARSPSAEDTDVVARKLTGLATAVSNLVHDSTVKYLDRTNDHDCWAFPADFTLDGDVLRVAHHVLAREQSPERAVDGKRWHQYADTAELHYLFKPIHKQGKQWGPKDLQRCPRPAWDEQPAPSSRKDSHYDETWVFHIGDIACDSTVLANTRKEHTRLFVLEREPHPEAPQPPLEICRPGRAGTARTTEPRAAATPRNIRFMVSGDSVRHHGSHHVRAGRYDADQLAQVLKTSADHIAGQDGTPPVVPTRVSLVGSHPESSAFWFSPTTPEPTFSERFIDRATELFGNQSITASAFTDAYRVATRGGHQVEHSNGDRYDVCVNYSVVETSDAELDGRKFVRGPTGEYMNKAPGGKVITGKAPDGTIWSVPKYPDYGQAHVKNSTQRPAELIAWLKQNAAPAAVSAATAGPLTAAASTPSAAEQRMLLGQVEIQRSLLQRMGWKDDGKPLDRPGAFVDLRFAEETLQKLLATATPPERIAAMRLLKQIMRTGVPGRELCYSGQASASPQSCSRTTTELLSHIDQAFDDDLQLPETLWKALWPNQDPPALPLRVPGKRLDPLPLV
ncbi:hypothetical protein [Roseateles sp. MS654]|uniref:hypothetical protein n=1 Tax=Roseateles sp. MS654 TaxID=3412685 RepID=UPI003C2DE16D